MCANFCVNRVLYGRDRGGGGGNFLIAQARVNLLKPANTNTLPFFFLFQPGTSIESFTREQRKEGNLKRSQPYLLGIGSRRLPTQFFVIIDERAIPCGGDVTSAVDVMFKLHFIFNIHYATELKAFYAFLEHYVYEVGLPKDVIPARASELMSSITAISSNK